MDDQIMVVSVARRVALTAAMAGLANVLALLSVPIPISSSGI